MASIVRGGGMAERLRCALVIGLVIISILYPSFASSSEHFYEALGLLKVTESVSAPQFELPDIKGKIVKLSDYRGKVVLINFWATWCVPCRQEMPSMERLYKKYKTKGFEILAISIDILGAKAVIPFMEELKLTFPALLDTNMRIGKAYGVRGIPVSFLLNKQGEVAAVAQGPRPWDNDAAGKLIESLLNK